MVAYKSSAVASFVKAPPPGCRAVLIYGPDAGLVAERINALANIFARRAKGDTEMVWLGERDLTDDPAPLQVELNTKPMFAAQSVVRLTVWPKFDPASLKALLATFDPPKGMGATNRGRYSNKAFDAKLEEALRTVDDAKRDQALAEAMEIGMNDVGLIPTHYQLNTWASRKGVKVQARTDEYTLATGIRKE